MLASTNIYTFKHTHIHLSTNIHTHTDWPKGMDPYCTVFTDEQSL